MFTVYDGMPRSAATLVAPAQPARPAHGLVALSDGVLVAADPLGTPFRVTLWQGQQYTLPVASIDWTASTVTGLTLLWS